MKDEHIFGLSENPYGLTAFEPYPPLFFWTSWDAKSCLKSCQRKSLISTSLNADLKARLTCFLKLSDFRSKGKTRVRLKPYFFELCGRCFFLVLSHAKKWSRTLD